MKHLIQVILFFAFVFNSCHDNFENLQQGHVTTAQETKNSMPIAYSDLHKGKVMKGYYHGEKIFYIRHNGENIYQGDILIPDGDIKEEPYRLEPAPENIKPSHRSVGRVFYRWPNNTVYYENQLKDVRKGRVEEAIEYWESKTNVKFKKRTNQENYVVFIPAKGCASFIGMIGGRQTIKVGKSCHVGNVIHEIGHTVGLNHEHNRLDRDQFLTIHFENIQKNMEINFKLPAATGPQRSKDLTPDIDFESIMLYNSYFFSKNDLPTMTKKNGDTFENNDFELSFGDLYGIYTLYPPKKKKRSRDDNRMTFINDTWYVIDDLKVLRSNDAWHFYDSDQQEWFEVVSINQKWYKTK